MTKIVPINDEKLPFIDSGVKSKPVIVFLAGFPDDQLSGWSNEVIEGFKATNRVIFSCLPGYEKDAVKQKPLGFNFETLLQMLHNTLTSLSVTDSPFYFVAHDWGAQLAMMYENKYPSLINKLALLDVGQFKPRNLPVKNMLIIMFYQWWFALAYLISQSLSVKLGRVVFESFFTPCIANNLGPCPHELILSDKKFTVQACYVYYQFWRSVFLRYATIISFPKCPLLFMYGIKKNAMFHDKVFLARIESNVGSKHVAFDGGHWFARTHGIEVLKELKAFLVE